MLTPDQLTERLAPARSDGPAYVTQLLVSDSAMDLAETILDTTHRGPQQDQALDLLIRAAHTAYAGINPGAAAEIAASARDQLAPYGLTDTDLDPALVLDVGAWRLGVRMSELHPLTRLAGLVLSDHCGPAGYIPDSVQPTMRDLCRQTGLPMQVLHAHLQDLRAHGWISRHTTTDDHGGRRFLFALRLPTPR